MKPLGSRKGKKLGKDRQRVQSQKNKMVQLLVPLRRSARHAKPVVKTSLLDTKIKKQKKRKQAKSKKERLKKQDKLKKPKNSCWQKKRTQISYGYWLNGLRLSRRLNDERVMLFRSKLLLVLSGESPSVACTPKCSLCGELEFKSHLNYVSCEICGGNYLYTWFISTTTKWKHIRCGRWIFPPSWINCWLRKIVFSPCLYENTLKILDRWWFRFLIEVLYACLTFGTTSSGKSHSNLLSITSLLLNYVFHNLQIGFMEMLLISMLLKLKSSSGLSAISVSIGALQFAPMFVLLKAANLPFSQKLMQGLTAPGKSLLVYPPWTKHLQIRNFNQMKNLMICFWLMMITRSNHQCQFYVQTRFRQVMQK